MASWLSRGLLARSSFCAVTAQRVFGLGPQWQQAAVKCRALSTESAVKETSVGGSAGPTPTEEDRAKEFREVTSRKDSIRISPWKINLLTRQIRGMPVVEALMQMSLSRKQKGPPIVAKVITNASNLASIRYDLNPEDLYVAEAFINRGHVQKGIMIHGRGRHGLKRRAYSHVVIKVREIDWETRISKAENRFQKARWEKRREIAQKVKDAREDRNTGKPLTATA